MNVNDSEYQPGGQAQQLDRKKPSIGKRLLLAALVVILFAGLGMGLGMSYRWVSPCLYQSDAKIFVDERQLPMAQGQNRSNIDLATSEKYMSIIKSNLVLVDAIKSGKFEDFEIFEGSEPLQPLRDRLLVEKADTRSDSGVIRLVFSGSNPEECKQVLAGVIDSFKQYIRNSDDAKKRPTERLQRSLNDTLDRLKKVEGEIKSLTSTPTSEATNRAEEGHNPFSEMLLKLKAEQSRLEVFYQTEVEKYHEAEAINEFKWRTLAVLDPPANPEFVGLNSVMCSAIGLILGGLAGFVVAMVGLIASLLFWK